MNQNGTIHLVAPSYYNPASGSTRAQVRTDVFGPQQELDDMKFLQSIYYFLIEMGRARAAAILAQRGDHEGARRLMD